MLTNSPIVILINTSSGGSKGSRLFDLLTDSKATLNSLPAYNIKVFEVDFERLQQQVENLLGADYLIIGGGDGTISSVVAELIKARRNGLIPENKQLPIGIIPLGTGNDLARELNIHNTVWPYSDLNGCLKQVEKMLSCPRVNIDTWDLKISFDKDSEHFIFCNYLSLGFNAKVVCDFHKVRHSLATENIRSKFLNRLGYVISALRNIFVYSFRSNLTLTVDNTALQLPSRYRSLILSNIRSIMGIGHINKTGQTCDGKLEIVCSRTIFDYLLMTVNSLLPLDLLKPIQSGTNCELSTTLDSLYMQIDGEPHQLKSPRKFTISHAGSLPFFCHLHKN